MTLYWMLGLIVAVVAAVFAMLRIRGGKRSLSKEVDIPIDWPVRAEERQDTAPAVLSPPEWKGPRPAR